MKGKIIAVISLTLILVSLIGLMTVFLLTSPPLKNKVTDVKPEKDINLSFLPEKNFTGENSICVEKKCSGSIEQIKNAENTSYNIMIETNRSRFKIMETYVHEMYHYQLFKEGVGTQYPENETHHKKLKEKGKIPISRIDTLTKGWKALTYIH